MEDTNGRPRGSTAPARAPASSCSRRRGASTHHSPLRTLSGWQATLGPGEAREGASRKLKSVFLAAACIRSSTSPPWASWWGWAGGGGAAQQQRKPDLRDKRLHRDMQQSFHCSWVSCSAHNAPVTRSWQVPFSVAGILESWLPQCLGHSVDSRAASEKKMWEVSFHFHSFPALVRRASLFGLRRGCRWLKEEVRGGARRPRFSRAGAGRARWLVSRPSAPPARGKAGGWTAAAPAPFPAVGSADAVTAQPAHGLATQRDPGRNSGARRETGACKCTHNLMIFVGGRCESLRGERRAGPPGGSRIPGPGAAIPPGFHLGQICARKG